MSARSESFRNRLTPHPASPRSPVHEIVVGAARHDDALLLNYRIVGELGAMRMPELRPPVHTDNLWRQTCFEAFTGATSSSEYCEYNFSPSGAWAAYHFSAYREGMAPLLKGAPPELVRSTGGETVELAVSLDLSWLTKSFAGRGLRLGLAAVIEDKAQVLSYWALKHPAEKPDFHHAGSFVVELD